MELVREVGVSFLAVENTAPKNSDVELTLSSSTQTFRGKVVEWSQRAFIAEAEVERLKDALVRSTAQEEKAKAVIAYYQEKMLSLLQESTGLNLFNGKGE